MEPNLPKAILVHGMSRTAASLLLLARRLRRRGLQPFRFGYRTRGSFETAVTRLTHTITTTTQGQPFILVGHSLGTVLIRAALPRLAVQPSACFFLAPPGTVCKAARTFSPNPLFRTATREMGSLLANEHFMANLPVPTVPVTIYAGTAGPHGRFSPFGDELNDGLLTLSEVALGSFPIIHVPALHPFIMHSAFVAEDIAKQAQRLMRISAA